jgi:hypothetical protein
MLLNQKNEESDDQPADDMPAGSVGLAASTKGCPRRRKRGIAAYRSIYRKPTERAP